MPVNPRHSHAYQRFEQEKGYREVGTDSTRGQTGGGRTSPPLPKDMKHIARILRSIQIGVPIGNPFWGVGK